MSLVFPKSLRKLGLSVARLVEDFPCEDDRGLAIRLLGAVGAIPTSLGRLSRSANSAERRIHVQAAQGSAVEAGYLVGLSQELGYGRPEQAHSAAGRIDMVLKQLRRPGPKSQPPRGPSRPPAAGNPVTGCK